METDFQISGTSRTTGDLDDVEAVAVDQECDVDIGGGGTAIPLA